MPDRSVSGRRYLAIGKRQHRQSLVPLRVRESESGRRKGITAVAHVNYIATGILRICSPC